jgi:Predicted nucleic acid-binding protein, contains PIN domain
MKNMILLIDTNVILDYLINREPFADAACEILRCCVEKRIKGYVAAHSIADIFYILRKHFSSAERKKMLRDFCELIDICGLQKIQIANALANENFNDLEDCIQAECAKSIQADYIVTRNIKDFVNSPITAILPEELLRIMKSV